MKTSSLLFFLLAGGILTAQGLQLPRESPSASTAFTIGYTTISVAYGSPAVNERDIWGKVVPYGQLWRAGANEATTIAFSTDVEVEGQACRPGRYAFFLIPRTEGSWTAIFNREDEQWGANEYDEGKDALRVEVAPRFAKQANEERLTYSIVGQNIENGYLLLSWEKLRLYLRIRVETMERAVREITEAIAVTEEGQKWEVYAEAADFFLWVGQLEPAMQYINNSLDLRETSLNYWVKGRIQAAKGDFAAAIGSLEKAEALGAANADDEFYRDSREEIGRRLTWWKSKLE